jgi:hypothetical protein
MTIRSLLVRRVTRTLPFCLLAFALGAAHAQTQTQTQTPEPFAAGKVKTATTTIQAVSQSDRHVVLLGEGGQHFMVEAGPEVRNFDKVRPGDRVVVSYMQGMVAEVKPKGEGSRGATSATTHPQAGERPSTSTVTTVAKTVTVESVDTADNTITFKPSDGISRTLPVETSDARRFIGELKPGDEVQLTYREAKAVSIEPARG